MRGFKYRAKNNLKIEDESHCKNTKKKKKLKKKEN